MIEARVKTLKAAYEPEAQAIAIHNAQLENKLSSHLVWVIGRKRKLLKKLQLNQVLLKIYLPGSRPDICFSRDEKLVYKSPGFDLDLYQWSKPQKSLVFTP